MDIPDRPSSGAVAATERDVQHLVEVAVVEATIPADTHERATHEPRHGRGIEVVDEQAEVGRELARPSE